MTYIHFRKRREQRGATAGATRRDLPIGCIFQNSRTGGWYWKGKPPGSQKVRYIPMVPHGSKHATKARGVALVIARDMIGRWKASAAGPVEVHGLLGHFEAVVARESSPKNAKAYRVAVLTFIAHSRIAQPWDISPANVQDYLTWLDAKPQSRAPATINKHRAAISAWCEFLIIRQLLPSNVALQVKRSRVYHRPPRFLTRPQVQVLLRLLLTRPAYLRAMVLLALDTGLRLSEMANLKWQYVNRRRVIVGADVAPKSYQWRTVPISPRAWAAMEALPGYHAPSGWVLPHKKSYSYVQSLRRVTKNLPVFGELPGRSAGNQWHLLRSTYGVNQARRGKTLWQLQQLMGHQSSQSTQRYVNIARAAGGA